jgi:hypothetical protein
MEKQRDLYWEKHWEKHWDWHLDLYREKQLD